MFGKGIVKGLSITMKYFFSKKVTEQYPEVKPKLPQRSIGSFGFDEDKCIACGICEDSCPNGVIKVDFSKDEKGRRVFENYRMNLGYCLFCGICVRVCPKSAVYSKPDFDIVCYSKEQTVHNWKKGGMKEDLVVKQSIDVSSTQKGEVSY